MDTFLICLAIIIAAFAIALLVWWLFKPKRESVVFIRPSTTRPNIIYKQGSGFGLDLGNRVVEEQDLAQQHSPAVREQVYQNQQAAARWAAEQDRRDQEAQMLQASRIENQNQPSCDSGSSSSSSSSSSD